MMEEQIRQKKDERSRLKAKVTGVSNQLSSAIDRIDESAADTLYNSLEDIYVEFSCTNETYSDLVSLDSQYEAFCTVGGLNLDEYAIAVERLYLNAVSKYNEFKGHRARLIEKTKMEASTIGKRAQLFKLSVDECLKANIQDSRLDTLLESTDTFIDSIESSQIALTKVGFFDLASNMDAIIFELTSLKLTKGRQLTTTPSSTVQASNILGDRPGDEMFVNTSVRTTDLRGSSPGATDAQVIAQPHLHNRESMNSTLTTSMLRSSGFQTRFKKSEPPTFSGNRSEWPEFRSFWRRYAELEFTCDQDRAYALKQALSGTPASYVRPIYATHSGAYDQIWQRLESVYSDTSMSVQAVYDQIKKLKPVSEENITGLINLINEIELCHSQLVEIDQVNAITMTHVDDIADLFCYSTRKDWLKVYRTLDTQCRIHPFGSFLEFLKSERDVTIRLAERYAKKNQFPRHNANHLINRTLQTHVSHLPLSDEKLDQTGDLDHVKCIMHKYTNSHYTTNCNEFSRIPVDKRLDIVKQEYACYKCLGPHYQNDCPSRKKCNFCYQNHHYLLCKTNPDKQLEPQRNLVSENSAISNHEQTNSSLISMNSSDIGISSVFAIQYANSYKHRKQQATMFFDSGSNTTYITHSGAARLGAKRLKSTKLEVTVMGDTKKLYNTCVYEVRLQAQSGKVITIKAYGMDSITTPVSNLNKDVIKDLFPDYNPCMLARNASNVDILIGIDYCGLHPRREVAHSGQHLFVMEGPFGLCIQGSHPKLSSFKLNKGNVTNRAQCNVIRNRENTSKLLVSLQTSNIHEFHQEAHNSATSEELFIENAPSCIGFQSSEDLVNEHLKPERQNHDVYNRKEITEYAEKTVILDSMSQVEVVVAADISNATRVNTVKTSTGTHIDSSSPDRCLETKKQTFEWVTRSAWSYLLIALYGLVLYKVVNEISKVRCLGLQPKEVFCVLDNKSLRQLQYYVQLRNFVKKVMLTFNNFSVKKKYYGYAGVPDSSGVPKPHRIALIVPGYQDYMI